MKMEGNYHLYDELVNFRTAAILGANKLRNRALRDYELALTMPRKKKKQAKKQAILLYQAAQYALESLYYKNQ